MSSDPVETCADALSEFRRATKDFDSGIPMPLFRRLEPLLSATEALIADCRRAQDEGDWS